MIRSLCTLAASLLAYIVLAAPAPKPFVSGWESPVDPDRDCKINRHNGVLTIEMPGTDHDYDPHRQRFNAPRLLRDFEGDFEIQVRVRIDCRPSAQSTVENQLSHVSAAFLIIPPDIFPNNCVRLEYRITGRGEGADGCVAAMVEGRRGPVVGHRPPKWPFQEKPDYVYLRLERWGEILSYHISSDGKSWVRTYCGCHLSRLPWKLKVGLAACSTSTDPSRVRFDQLKIIPGKKRDQWDFVSGWDDPVDSDKDCKIKREKDALSIEMPGIDHDYNPVRKRFNAPRLPSELEADFDLVVRVRIESRPSTSSTAKGQPSFVSAGFLLIYPKTNESICERMEYVVLQQGNRLDRDAIAPLLAKPRRNGPAPEGAEAEGYVAMKTWICKQRKANGTEWDRGMPQLHGNGIWERGWQDWPLPEKADCAYLRLEQRDEWYCFFISPDGKKWTPLTYQKSLPAKRKLALAAYSNSSEPSKVIFDQLKLARSGKKGK